MALGSPSISEYPMADLIHLIPGERYGKLTIIKEAEPVRTPRWKIRHYLCLCDCGTVRPIRMDTLRRGDSKSCGCILRDRNQSAKNGATDEDGKITPTYTTWASMKARCLDPKNKRFSAYGAKGVTVCERWMDYANFLADMGQKPGPDYSIDRIDPYGNYAPENCQWIPMEVNRRKHRFHTVTPETAAQAKALFLAGASPKDIAKMTGFSAASAGMITRGHQWTWVPLDRDYLLSLTKPLYVGCV